MNPYKTFFVMFFAAIVIVTAIIWWGLISIDQKLEPQIFFSDDYNVQALYKETLRIVPQGSDVFCRGYSESSFCIIGIKSYEMIKPKEKNVFEVIDNNSLEPVLIMRDTNLQIGVNLIPYPCDISVTLDKNYATVIDEGDSWGVYTFDPDPRFYFPQYIRLHKTLYYENFDYNGEGRCFKRKEGETKREGSE